MEHRPSVDLEKLDVLCEQLKDRDSRVLEQAIADVVDQLHPDAGKYLRSKLELDSDSETEDLKSEGSKGEPAYYGLLKPGDVLGPFRIEKLLGEGGMGAVYLAGRQDDLDLKVALKTLVYWPPKMLDLFRVEMKVLSALKHPGIAHLIDAGTTQQGQPWLAMEYVPGLSLSEYLAQNKPDLKERLRLFIAICDALSHAHRSMVIHRDLKPGNIMVTADGRPKLLDFGIASALDPSTGEQLTITVKADRIMTPEYASPEQINGQRLSAASDVYSLGILLYEVLTGIRPYKFKTHGALDLVRVVTEAPIARPSLVRPGNRGEGVASTLLRGDLDTIVLKALERDIARRYPSVEALSGDLQLYLHGLPITARPATFFYRMRKFVRRHPWPLAMGASLLVMLLAFAIYANQQRRIIASERDLAQAKQNTAQSVTHFMVNLFEQVDPDVTQGGDITAYEVLEVGRRQIDHTLSNQPDVKVHLLATMGRVYRALGKYDSSQALLEEAISLERKHEMDITLHVFSLVTTFQMGGKLEQAQVELDRLGTLLDGQKDTEKTRMMHAYYNQLQGDQYFWTGQYKLANEAYARARSLNGLDDEQLMSLKTTQSQIYAAMGDYDTAIKNLDDVLQLQIRVFGEYHSQVAQTLISIGRYSAITGQFDRSDTCFQEVERIYDQIYDGKHPKHSQLMDEMATALLYKGKYDEAEVLYREAFNLREDLLEEDHPLYISSLMNLAAITLRRGGIEEAELMYRKGLEQSERSLGKNHPIYGKFLLGLASLFRSKGDFKSAERLQRESLEVVLQTMGEKHPDYALGISNLAIIQAGKGRFDEADKLYQQALEVTKNSLGVKNQQYSNLLNNYAYFLQGRGRFEQAEAYFREAVVLRGELLGRDNTEYASSLYNLGNLLLQMGRLEEVETFYKEALGIKRKALGETHNHTLHFKNSLADLYQRRGKLAESEALYRDLLASRRERYGNNVKVVAAALYGLADVVCAQGRVDEAQTHAREAIAILDEIDSQDISLSHSVSSVMGAIEVAQGNVSAGEQKLLDAYEALSRLEGKADSSTQKALKRLLDAYDGLGKTAQANTYRKELLPQNPDTGRPTPTKGSD